MMIPAAVAAKLNEQITNEMNASQKYLAIACQLETMGLTSLAGFFRKQTEEERAHALKILDYLLEVGAAVALAPLPAPQAEFATVVAAIDASVEHEQLVTRQIHDLVALCEREKDYATRSFLQWYVDEQVEEVSSMAQLAQVARLARENLLQLDGYVARLLSK
ncbi:MAG: ferritin [Phycisphaerales bacterium]|nr:ferritin [Phycisphaerales bacterium]